MTRIGDSLTSLAVHRFITRGTRGKSRLLVGISPDRQKIVGRHRMESNAVEAVLLGNGIEIVQIANSHARIAIAERSIEIGIALARELAVAVERPIKAESTSRIQDASGKREHALDFWQAHDMCRIRREDGIESLTEIGR